MNEAQILLIQIVTVAGLIYEINDAMESMISQLKDLVTNEQYDAVKYMKADATEVEAPLNRVIENAKKLLGVQV